ncbi:hypothetical protein ACFL01_01090 [Planctomycetota bacterium]
MVLVLLCVALPVAAAVFQKKFAPKKVVVMEGDTAESLAKTHLGDSDAAGELLKFNKIEGDVLPAPGGAIMIPGAARYMASVQIHYARSTFDKAQRGSMPVGPSEGEKLLLEAEEALRRAQYERSVELANTSWQKSRAVIAAAREETKLSIATTAGGEDRVAVDKGSVTMRAGGLGSSVTVGEGQGVKVGKGETDLAVRNLLPPPEIVLTAGTVLYNAESVLLEWKQLEGAVRYDVSFASDAEVRTTIAPDESTKETSLKRDVPGAGEYFWKVRAIDEDDMPGKWSAPISFKVVNDTTPPSIRLEKSEWE